MKKRIAALMLIMMLCMTAMAATVRATGTVNLRKGPGKGYDIITAVTEGTKLPYADETVTDERGVKWYGVWYDGDKAWISEKFSVLEGDVVKPIDEQALKTYVEVSGYYGKSLTDAAKKLGLDTHVHNEHSEVPESYTDGSLALMGYKTVEAMSLTGPGYTLFGVAVGMDQQRVKELLTEAGLDYFGDGYGGAMIFEHLSKNGMDHDGCINVEFKDGIATCLDWSTYTG